MLCVFFSFLSLFENAINCWFLFMICNYLCSFVTLYLSLKEDRCEKGKVKDNVFFFTEFVISLTASDEFLKNRIINLPESVVAGTHYTQDRFLQSLNNFREINVEDETVLNYFDELEIHPQFIGMK